MTSASSSKKNGLVIADSGAIFSLAVLEQLELLNALFDDIAIPNAVWQEITLDRTVSFYSRMRSFFKERVRSVKGTNVLTPLMDYGESECVLLCKEAAADFLLIDDRKARKIAENFGIRCIGTIGLLAVARQKKIIPALLPLFEILLHNKRFYSLEMLNAVLAQHNEGRLD
jgi:uncharacterized protein